MKLTFFGAARAVTGSCHCLDVGDKRILIDCGLQQGQDEIDNGSFLFDAQEVDYVIVTHAHIDHSGRLPLLCKQGFRGRIVTTRLTEELLSIMLRDSAHIQESDAMWENQKGKRAGRAPVEPLYTVADVEPCLKLMEHHDYGQIFDLCEGVKVRFTDAGHLLGSAIAEVWVTEDGKTEKIVFSGDLGNKNQPIIRDPQFVTEADYVVTESTYGDRLHAENEGSYVNELAEIMDSTFANGGNVVIPAFAVGRTQELLYFIREIKEKGLVHSNPEFPVYVDSPLALEATQVFSGDLTGYVDEEALMLALGGVKMLTFPGLHLCESTDESRALNADKTPKVIISASGMCDAGRIRHHLKHNLWRPECSIVFVGFQAKGSFGRRLLEGVKNVKLFGEEIAVQAKIVNFPGLSSHADKNGLLAWISAFSPRPKQVFVVHGDPAVAPVYAETLTQLGFAAHVPELGEIYDLTNNTLIAAGHTPERKPRPEAENPLFTALVAAARHLMEVVERCKGAANRDLRAFTLAIQELCDRYDIK
ncbi:MAG: MBL fold metallo-hydrolase [Clostridiaceae bacterium]|nr:MBL fold metallo-hydrolase [Clostridiaceae bacterium]